MFQSKRILHSDRNLGWKLQPHLNTEFYQKSLYSDGRGNRVASKEASGLNDSAYSGVLTMGPSSAFGWGVDFEETYSALVSKNLNLNIYNASQIGYSVHQGLLLFNNDQLPNIKNFKIVIIAYGVNDLDKFRFYDSNFGSDEEYFSKYLKTHGSGSEFLGNLGKVTSIFMHEISLLTDCRALIDIQQRVSLQTYLDKIAELVKTIRISGVTPVLINTPYYYEASRITSNEGHIDQLYNEVKVAAKNGHCSEALGFLKKAKSFESLRVFEDVKKLNQSLLELSQQYKIIYVDAFSILQSQNAKENFVDPVHPSAKGHNLISVAILKALSGKGAGFE
ncbi:MAG: SGNH/GDSL hydrolase family protein [Pseudobdellovibrio sp.]